MHRKDVIQIVITRRLRSVGFKITKNSLRNPPRPTILNVTHRNMTRTQARDFADRIEKHKHVFRVQVFVKSGGFL